jgi:hypothetical protein
MADTNSNHPRVTEDVDGRYLKGYTEDADGTLYPIYGLTYGEAGDLSSITKATPLPIYTSPGDQCILSEILYEMKLVRAQLEAISGEKITRNDL